MKRWTMERIEFWLGVALVCIWLGVSCYSSVRSRREAERRERWFQKAAGVKIHGIPE